MLAVADEDGYVSCLNTEKPLPGNLDVNDAACTINAQWLAHDNAIFDLCWMQVWQDLQVQLQFANVLQLLFPMENACQARKTTFRISLRPDC